jgi:site-specific recombinase XerC
MVFFDEINNPKHFAFFLNLYGSGLRISEMVSLKTKDINKKRMLVHVRNGKVGKERYTPLATAGHRWSYGPSTLLEIVQTGKRAELPFPGLYINTLALDKCL